MYSHQRGSGLKMLHFINRSFHTYEFYFTFALVLIAEIVYVAVNSEGPVNFAHWKDLGLNRPRDTDLSRCVAILETLFKRKSKLNIVT